MKPERAGQPLSPGLKRKIVDAVVECYASAPASIVAIAPDLYAELKQELGTGPQQRMFEGYVTEREQIDRTSKLSILLEQTSPSRDEGLEMLEHLVALDTADAELRARVLERVEEPLRLELTRPRNDTITAKREPVMKMVTLVAGVVLHLGFDGRLVKIQFVRDAMARRCAAMSLCGIVAASR